MNNIHEVTGREYVRNTQTTGYANKDEGSGVEYIL